MTDPKPSSEKLRSDLLSSPENNSPENSSPEDDVITFDRQVRGESFKQILRKPVTIAAICLTIGVIGLVAFLESGSVYMELPTPEVSYELLRNEGLTDGVPIAIKINQVAVFKIDDPMLGGNASRAKQIVESLEGAIQDLEDQPGRAITLDLDSSELPAIVQNSIDGTGKRVLIQLTPGDLVVAGKDDAKWVARVWAERVTDALKVFMFGEAPQFTEGSEFGDALTTMYLQALRDRGAISIGALNNAYDELNEIQQLALLDFPVPPETQEQPAAQETAAN